MTVRLDSIPVVSTEVPNVTWAAVIALALAYEIDKVHPWNGCHDGDQTWTPAELTIMADRLEQTAALVPVLRDLAKTGGVAIS